MFNTNNVQLQVVQGKGITADEYEGSPLQDSKDLAYYNITEGSEIVFERIILPKFLNSARYFEKVTAIREYLKYRFGDINKIKKINNYYSAAHKNNSSANSNNNHIVGSVQSFSSLEEQNKILLLQKNLFMLPAGLCNLIQSYVFPKVGSIVVNYIYYAL